MESAGVVTADGAKSDCERLLNCFMDASETGSFADFAAGFKKLNFHMIFSGREPTVELKEFTKELLLVAKSCLFASHKLKKRVGCIYLLYSLYFKQTSGVKIRLTANELSSLFKSLKEMREQNFREAEFTFYKLLVNGAFHFTATSSEHIHQTEPKEDSILYKTDIGDQLRSSVDNFEVLQDLDLRYRSLMDSSHLSGSHSHADVKCDFINTLRDQLSQLKDNIGKHRGVPNVKRYSRDYKSCWSEDMGSSDESDDDESVTAISSSKKRGQQTQHQNTWPAKYPKLSR